MGAIIALITQVIDLAPNLIAQGVDMYAFVQQARAAVDHIGTQVSPDDEAFKELDAKVAKLETIFKTAVDKRLAEAAPDPAAGDGTAPAAA